MLSKNLPFMGPMFLWVEYIESCPMIDLGLPKHCSDIVAA